MGQAAAGTVSRHQFFGTTGRYWRAAQESGRQAARPRAGYWLATTPSAAGQQNRNDSATESSHTDSNLLHRNSPLRDISAATAGGGGATRSAQGFSWL